MGKREIGHCRRGIFHGCADNRCIKNVPRFPVSSSFRLMPLPRVLERPMRVLDMPGQSLILTKLSLALTYCSRKPRGFDVVEPRAVYFLQLDAILCIAEPKWNGRATQKSVCRVLDGGFNFFPTLVLHPPLSVSFARFALYYRSIVPRSQSLLSNLSVHCQARPIPTTARTYRMKNILALLGIVGCAVAA